MLFDPLSVVVLAVIHPISDISTLITNSYSFIEVAVHSPGCDILMNLMCFVYRAKLIDLLGAFGEGHLGRRVFKLAIYKAEYAGKIVELVNPNGTSQTCICGFPVPKDLSVRVHNCPNCGLVMDRDHVSAILIKNRSSTAGITGIQAQPSNPNREAMKWEAPCESKVVHC